MIEVTNFIRPHGKKVVTTIEKVIPKDAEYININKIKVSMEDMGFDFAVWFDDGHVTDEGEPNEILVFAEGRTCEETISEGVELVKARNPKA